MQRRNLMLLAASVADIGPIDPWSKECRLAKLGQQPSILAALSTRGGTTRGKGPVPPLNPAAGGEACE